MAAGKVFFSVTLTRPRRFFRDNLTIGQDVALIGDTTNSSCQLPRYPPCVRGQPQTIQTFRVHAIDMCWELDNTGELAVHHWRTLFQQNNLDAVNPDAGNQIRPGDLRFIRCLFDGRKVDMNGESNAVWAQMGFQVPPSQSVRFRFSNDLPPETRAYFEMVNCTVQNYAFYPEDPRVVNGTSNVTLVVDANTYPTPRGVYVEAINTIRTNTSTKVTGNLFENLDDYSIWLRRFINNTVAYNIGRNTTCRSKGNMFDVNVEGNVHFSNTSLWALAMGLGQSTQFIAYNNFSQDRPCTFPDSEYFATPVGVASYQMRDFPDGTIFCFWNNSAHGHRYNVRITDMNATTMSSCLRYPNQIFFFDYLRHLRALMNEGNCHEDPLLDPMNATTHNGEFLKAGHHLEFHEEGQICDHCCVPFDPTVC